MAEARKLLAQVQLGAALADIYVPPTLNGLKAVVQALFICNTDTVARAVTIRVGVGVLTAANSLFEAVPIAGNTVYVLPGSEWTLIVESGAHLQGLCDSANKVTISVFGAEIS